MFKDFHVSNLMLVDRQIGLIDTQDALIGNKAYDLIFNRRCKIKQYH